MQIWHTIYRISEEGIGYSDIRIVPDITMLLSYDKKIMNKKQQPTMGAAGQ